jgi:hypothetical protein
MAATSLEEGLEVRTEDLKKLWETLKPRVPFVDARRTKIENYLREIPARVHRREGYEAIFTLTRIATMLGEIRIEFRDAKAEETEVDGNNKRNIEERAFEETPTNLYPISRGTPDIDK